MVRFKVAGSRIKPGAVVRTTIGENIIPNKVRTESDASDILNNTLAARKNSESMPFALYSLNTGTIAEFIAPSPTRSLNEFGILNATKKACAVKLVPKKLAITMSRTNPRILLIAVAALITPVDLIRCFLLISLDYSYSRVI